MFASENQSHRTPNTERHNKGKEKKKVVLCIITPRVKWTSPILFIIIIILSKNGAKIVCWFLEVLIQDTVVNGRSISFCMEIKNKIHKKTKKIYEKKAEFIHGMDFGFAFLYLRVRFCEPYSESDWTDSPILYKWGHFYVFIIITSLNF